MILLGNLCSCAMLLMNRVDSPADVIVLVQEIKCPTSKELSTMTNIESKPPTAGRSVMKPIETENQSCGAIDSDCNRPAGLIQVDFTQE